MKGRAAIIVPVRLESLRLPRKPLATIDGVTMLERVVDICKKADITEEVYVATDSAEVKSFCHEIGIDVIETGTHKCGTDRVYEAAKKIGAEVVVNVQGDEPLLDPKTIRDIYGILSSVSSNSCSIVNAYCKCQHEDIADRNSVKVVVNRFNRAVYYSRSPIASDSMEGKARYFKQQGVYGYSITTLEQFNKLGVSGLEDIENIELMRAIEYSVPINMVFSEIASYSVDTIDDLVRVENIIRHQRRG